MGEEMHFRGEEEGMTVQLSVLRESVELTDVVHQQIMPVLESALDGVVVLQKIG